MCGGGGRGLSRGGACFGPPARRPLEPCLHRGVTETHQPCPGPNNTYVLYQYHHIWGTNYNSEQEGNCRRIYSRMREKPGSCTKGGTTVRGWVGTDSRVGLVLPPPPHGDLYLEPCLLEEGVLETHQPYICPGPDNTNQYHHIVGTT